MTGRKTAPTLGGRPLWIDVEWWMKDHPRAAFLARPLHAFAMWHWRRKRRRFVAKRLAEEARANSPAPSATPITGELRLSPRVVMGDAKIACPGCNETIATADNAASRTYTFERGAMSVKMTGVVCYACKRSYTVEITSPPLLIADKLSGHSDVLTVTPEPNPPAPRYTNWLAVKRSDDLSGA